MISRGLDLAAVSADDQVLDLLAARAPAGGADRAAVLLEAFAISVDDGLEVLLQQVPVVPGSAQGLTVVADAPVRPRWVGPSRRLGHRSAAAAVVLVAALSVSGAAAAVTGNPLTAYEKVKDLVVTVTGRDDGRAAPAPSVRPRGRGGTRAPASGLPGGGAPGRTGEGSAVPDSRSTPSSTPHSVREKAKKLWKSTGSKQRRRSELPNPTDRATKSAKAKPAPRPPKPLPRASRMLKAAENPAKAHAERR